MKRMGSLQGLPGIISSFPKTAKDGQTETLEIS
jgi:hypothetical protein